MTFLVSIILSSVLGLFVFERFFGSLRVSRIITGIIFTGAILLFVVGYSTPLRGLGTGSLGDIDPWHVFHYDLNARYLDELEYTSLYTCALKADEATAHFWDDIQEVRDLKTYALVPRSALAPCPQDRFSKDRWQQFQSDIVEIQTSLSIPKNESYASWNNEKNAYWRAIFQDKGYNLSPFAARVTQNVFNALPRTHGQQWRVIFIAELLFLLLAIIGVTLTFSARAAALFSLWVVTFFGTYPFLVGMLLQHLWLPLVIFGFMAWQRGSKNRSIGFFVIATFMRIFPVFFLFPLLVSLRGKKEYSFALLTLFGTSIFACTFGGSFALWGSYLEKISAHRSFLAQELFNIGWPTLSGQLVPGTQSFFLMGALLLTFFYVMVVRRTSVIQQSILSIVLIYAWLALSPYYYLIIPLIAFLQPSLSVRMARLSAIAATVILLGHAVTGQFGLVYFSNEKISHLVSELSMLALLLFHLWLAWRDTLENTRNLSANNS